MLPLKFRTILDKIGASYRSNEATQSANKLAQLQELIVGDDGVSGTVYGTGDETFILKCVSAADSAAIAMQPDNVNEKVYSPLFSAFASYLTTVGFSSLDVYATAQNIASPYSFLIDPNSAYLYQLYVNNRGNILLSPGNVFAPQTNYGNCTVGTGGAISFVDAATVPVINTIAPPAQGYTPPTGVKANVTTTINGALTVAVTYNGISAAGGTITGQTGTLTLSNLTAGSSATMTPQTAGDRIADITAVAKTGSPTATAGVFTLDSVLERIIS